MSDTRFIVSTTLEGFVNALKPSGKYNNCCFSARLNKDDLAKFDKAYEQAMAWGKAKMDGKRYTEELPKWDESGFFKYSYGGESGAPMFPWVDTDGVSIDPETPVWKGTAVKLIIDLKPYVYGSKVGCSFKVKGAQVVRLVGNGGSDSGDLDLEDVASIFGTSDGYKAGSPSFEPDDKSLEENPISDDDIPF